MGLVTLLENQVLCHYIVPLRSSFSQMGLVHIAANFRNCFLWNPITSYHSFCKNSLFWSSWIFLVALVTKINEKKRLQNIAIWSRTYQKNGCPIEWRQKPRNHEFKTWVHLPLIYLPSKSMLGMASITLLKVTSTNVTSCWMMSIISPEISCYLLLL